MSNKPNNAGKPVNAPKSKGAELAAAASKRRRDELEERRRKAQQQQRTVLFVGAVAVLVVIVVAVILLSQPPSATFADGDLTTYAGMQTGTTQTGPNAGLQYPIALPYLGNPNAPVKIEEIASFSCPFCLQYHDNTFSSITDEIKAGRAQFIYIFTTKTGDFNAVPGTSAAVCAMQQNMFWPMHDILYTWQKTYGGGAADSARLRLAAQHLGLDMGKYDSCVTSKATSDYVAASDDYANARGLRGTPSIFLFVNGKQITPVGGNTSGETPGSEAGIPLSNLRGLMESASVPTPAGTAAATAAATSAATSVATQTVATAAPTAAATSAATAKS